MKTKYNSSTNRQIKKQGCVMAKRLMIEPKWCKGCGICAAFCPKNVLEIRKEKVFAVNLQDCIGCGLCELRCPDYAIYLEKEAD